MSVDFPPLGSLPPGSDSAPLASQADDGRVDDPQSFGSSSPSASVVQQGQSINQLPLELVLSVIFFHTLQKQTRPDR